MNDDIFNALTILVDGGEAHVMYVPQYHDEPDESAAQVPFQIDGIILGITEEAIEGQFVIMFEDETDELGAGLRSIPLDWVVGAVEKGAH